MDNFVKRKYMCFLKFTANSLRTKSKNKQRKKTSYVEFSTCPDFFVCLAYFMPILLFKN